jgi:hypothetical protein
MFNFEKCSNMNCSNSKIVQIWKYSNSKIVQIEKRINIIIIRIWKIVGNKWKEKEKLGRPTIQPLGWGVCGTPYGLTRSVYRSTHHPLPSGVHRSTEAGTTWPFLCVAWHTVSAAIWAFKPIRLNWKFGAPQNFGPCAAVWRSHTYASGLG